LDERNQKQVAVDMQVNSQLSLDLNDFKEVIVRTALGGEFQSLGGATERVQEPNNVRVMQGKARGVHWWSAARSRISMKRS